MTERTATVLHGFTNLSASEQNEFIQILNDYLKRTEVGRTPLREEFKKGTRVSLGPVSPGCVCCGRK